MVTGEKMRIFMIIVFCAIASVIVSTYRCIASMHHEQERQCTLESLSILREHLSPDLIDTLCQISNERTTEWTFEHSRDDGDTIIAKKR